MKGIGTALKWFLGIVLGLFVLMAIVSVIGVTAYISEGNAVQASAARLQNAINEVHNCAVDCVQSGEECNCQEDVEIKMPQGNTDSGFSLPLVGDLFTAVVGEVDPRWMIFHNIDKGVANTIGNLGDFLGHPIIETLDIISNPNYKKCKKKSICYGFIDQSKNYDFEIEAESVGIVKNSHRKNYFWLLSPCHGIFRVYYKKGDDPDNLRLCYVKSTTKGKNFCFGEGLGNQLWPGGNELSSIKCG